MIDIFRRLPKDEKAKWKQRFEEGLRDVLLKEPDPAYESSSQEKAHRMTQSAALDDAITTGRHEQRSTDRWYMGFLGALAFGAGWLYANNALDTDSLQLKVAILILAGLTCVWWVMDKDALFWENSVRYREQNILEDGLPANKKRAAWWARKQRGPFGKPPKDVKREATHSNTIVRVDWVRVVFLKPLLTFLVTLVLLFVVF